MDYINICCYINIKNYDKRNYNFNANVDNLLNSKCRIKCSC